MDSHLRTVYKSISWRLVGSGITASLFFLVTGEFVLSLSVGVFELMIKFVAYYAHERCWELTRWGKKMI